MRYLAELLRYIFRDLRSHKLRSLLAMFGIAWGTFSVVMLLALGEAYHNANKNKLMGIAENSLAFWPGAISKPYHGHPIGEEIQIKAAEIEQLRDILPGIRWISPTIRPTDPITLSHGNQQVDATISSVNEDSALIDKLKFQPGGRFFNRLDIKLEQQVIVIDDPIQKKLFGNASALNKEILFNGMPFKVIGIKQEKDTSFMSSQYLAYIPYTTAIKLWGNENVRQFIVTPLPTQTVSILKYRVLHYFSAKHGFDPTDQQAMYFYDFSQLSQYFRWFFNAIKIFLAVCGAMTLGIGGVGISNMMYLIVTERTAEIGLRMALGAQPHHILWQFLLESTVIVALGSLAGLLLSAVILIILHQITLPASLGVPTFSASVFLITAFILLLITLLAGYFPAKRAAALLPIQALTF